MEDLHPPVSEIGSAGPTQRDAALPADDARARLIQRTAALSLDSRIALFDCLSRDAAWALRATRIR